MNAKVLLILRRCILGTIFTVPGMKPLAKKIINALFGWYIPCVNVKAHLNLKNMFEAALLDNQVSELQNLFLYHSLLQPEDVVLNIGITTGLAPIFLAKNIVHEGKVYVIESNPATVKRFNKNSRLNNLHNIARLNTLQEAFSEIPANTIALLRFSTGAHIDFNQLRSFIEENSGMHVIWEASAREDLVNIAESFSALQRRCRIMYKGRLLPMIEVATCCEGAAALALNENPAISVGVERTIPLNDTGARTKISGFSILRSASIYPFELCYESILDFVDEFVLAVDTQPPESPFGREWSNDVLLDEFLTKTQHAEKVKIIEFDFKAREYQQYDPIGRWIADANNRALEACSYDICIYLMADEMYHEDTYQRDIVRFIESGHDALSYYYLKFVGDLHHVIDINCSTYSEAIRVFKKDTFYSYYDGFSFEAFTQEAIRVEKAKLPLYHLGYVINFKEKQVEHTTRNRLFKNATSSYIEQFPIVPLSVPLPKYAYIQKYRSSQKMMEFL